MYQSLKCGIGPEELLGLIQLSLKMQRLEIKNYLVEIRRQTDTFY